MEALPHRTLEDLVPKNANGLMDTSCLTWDTQNEGSGGLPVVSLVFIISSSKSQFCI